MSQKVILITGASSGFGRLTAEALAKAGHRVHASMRDIKGRNARNAEAMRQFSAAKGVDLRPVELDVQSQSSVDDAVARVIAESGRIDILMHNAGHMVFGPAEAFTPEQYAELYDINVLSTQRVNRAVLPHLRRQQQGLLVWVSSSSSAGGTPPYLAPYFAAKAAMDAIAVQYARELARWGIETTIIVPAPSPAAPITSSTPAGRPTRRGRRNTRSDPMPASARRCRRLLPISCRPMPMRHASPKRLSMWSELPSASGRSVCISIRPKTAPMSASPSSTGCAPRCCAVSGWPTS
jgi:NAD(P)-dependent dehydrogenase (short-subunit alcohol dehydrogenase family)